MKFSYAIEQFIVDMRSTGRINSPKTEIAYRSVLNRHGEDISNRDPRTVGREDCKRTLARWPNPNTQRCSRAILVSFFDWAMEEGIRKDNPARQTRRPKRKPTSVYRLTREECAAMLQAAGPGFERHAIYLMICAGLRSAEVRGVRGRHFQRTGFVHVSADIAKGGRERWVPVIPELELVVAEIRRTPQDHFVLPGTHRYGGGWGHERETTVFPDRGMSSQALQRLVHRVARNADIRAHIHPHLLRHAFADHVARHAGLFHAQALLGHADVGTTQNYVGTSTLEELAAVVAQLRFGYPPDDDPAVAERRGRDSNPRSGPALALPDFLAAWLDGQADRVAIYADHFRGETA